MTLDAVYGGARWSAPRQITFLRALDDELEREPLLKFRLYYEGELRPNQRDPEGQQRDPLAIHKHKIRRVFHKQLKYLWTTNSFLKNYRRAVAGDIAARPVGIASAHFDYNDKDKIPLSEYIAGNFMENGYRFLPLICEEFSLLCSLDILFLRRGVPGTAIEGGDIDNRIKTLIDTLRKPKGAQELRGNETPQPDENPFFCLLQEDNLVSHFAVETDTLLDEPTENDADQRKARVIITVRIQPYEPTYFNLAFS